jgi:hypothetical protein
VSAGAVCLLAAVLALSACADGRYPAEPSQEDIPWLDLGDHVWVTGYVTETGVECLVVHGRQQDGVAVTCDWAGREL